jgi:hypothetical protein
VSSFSPLTPAGEGLISRRGFARSPLRGEGARRASLVGSSFTVALVTFCFAADFVLAWKTQSATNAATHNQSSTRIHRGLPLP